MGCFIKDVFSDIRMKIYYIGNDNYILHDKLDGYEDEEENDREIPCNLYRRGIKKLQYGIALFKIDRIKWSDIEL